jgi:hypothetical protein
LKKILFYFKHFIVIIENMTLAPRPRIGPPFWVYPIQRAQAILEHAFFDKKFHTTKSARPLSVKILELISAFWPANYK